MLDNDSLAVASAKLKGAGGFGHRDALEAWNSLRALRDD